MLLERLMGLVAPVECLGCEREGAVICATCWELVVEYPGQCYRCGRPCAEGRTCERCRPGAHLTIVQVAARYEGVVKELILRLKFERARGNAAVAADLMVGRLGGVESIEAVIAVPVAPARYRERSYNQAELIARAVARRLGLPYRLVLARTTTDHQMGRRRRERLKGVQGAFYATRRLRGERVLLVDDVITTGATLAECAAVLQEAGASEIRAAVVAR